MKKIMYVLLDESKNSSITIKTPEFNITVIQGNKAYLCQPMIGQRWHTIYLDKQLNTVAYRDWINEVIKPCCTLKDSEGVFFI